MHNFCIKSTLVDQFEPYQVLLVDGPYAGEVLEHYKCLYFDVVEHNPSTNTERTTRYNMRPFTKDGCKYMLAVSSKVLAHDWSDIDGAIEASQLRPYATDAKVEVMQATFVTGETKEFFTKVPHGWHYDDLHKLKYGEPDTW